MTIPYPTSAFPPIEEGGLLASRRQDGWSAANQRRFLEAIAEGRGVEAACYHVGLSAASAYAFRRTAKGAAFALGWRAASLVARECVADTLMARALDGQVETIVRADGSSVTRHRHDNRLAMGLLARLDRQVETTPDPDLKAARLVAQEFDAFLELVGRDAGPARAGLFLARRCGALVGDHAGTAPADRAAAADPAGLADLAPIYVLAAADRLVRTGVATAGEVEIADLDPAARAGWTAEQWARAEAAGLLRFALPGDAAGEGEEDDPESARSPQHSQHSLAELDPPVWWDPDADGWRTSFPPADDFDGVEHGERGHVDYERALSDAEAAVMGRSPDHYDDAALAERCAARDAFFAPDPLSGPAPAPPDRDADAPPVAALHSAGTAPRTALRTAAVAPDSLFAGNVPI